jgi:hypothetical protein
VTCAALLIAAPIAIFVSNGPSGGGSTTDPDGVFTGDRGTGADGGSRGGGTGVATEASESPAAGLPPVDAVDAGNAGSAVSGGTAAGGTGIGSGTAAGPAAPAGGGTQSGGTGGGTAAGAPAASGGGSSTGGSGSGAPAGGGTQPGGNGGTTPPAQQPPPAEPEDPCVCETVTGVVDGLIDTTGQVTGGLVP